ncbi:hypothetical protein K7X08_009522 [Anisodus acutangulus]|uniref:Uncharacterized protein n=1 Tax=Anisodus acutangulus TaxID=402998 RepID=A0A9Q1N128_9SOLA|nr:hypothetical protein K7X08_009522 [Anisodus acutangulus]
MAATINMAWSQVMAARDVDYNISGMKERLLPQLNTCGRLCNSNDHCSDCIICCTCRQSPLFDEYICL